MEYNPSLPKWINTTELDDIPNVISANFDYHRTLIDMDRDIRDLYCHEYLSDNDTEVSCVFKNKMYHMIHECTAVSNKYTLRSIPRTPVWKDIRALIHYEPFYKQKLCMKCYRKLSEKENARYKKLKADCDDNQKQGQ